MKHYGFDHHLNPQHPMITNLKYVGPCGIKDDGFHCTLPAHHCGSHQAHDIDAKVVHMWVNVNEIIEGSC